MGRIAVEKGNGPYHFIGCEVSIMHGPWLGADVRNGSYYLVKRYDGTVVIKRGDKLDLTPSEHTLLLARNKLARLRLEAQQALEESREGVRWDRGLNRWY